MDDLNLKRYVKRYIFRAVEVIVTVVFALLIGLYAAEIESKSWSGCYSR